MGLVSVLSTIGTCLFIYLSLKTLLNSRFYAILGVLIYGTSALVISQSVIIQTYATVCLTATGAYYFYLIKRYKLMGLFLGIGLAVHLLAGFIFLIMFFACKEYRKNWKALLITLSFGLFYLYIPLTNRPPYMWLPSPDKVNTVWATIGDVLWIIYMLIGKLSVWDLPKRIMDTAGILLVSLGIVSVIPIVYYFKTERLSKNVLFWLSIIPIALFISELDMNTYDYTMLSIPFLSIAACLGLHKWVYHASERGGWFWTGNILTALTLVSVLLFGIYNYNYFDIGRTLDKDMEAANLYYNEFAKIPDKAIFISSYGWEWEAVYKFNADYKKNIYPICVDKLQEVSYREQLKHDGIHLLGDELVQGGYSVKGRIFGQMIIEQNDNVWTTISTNPNTLGSKVVPANHDIKLVDTFNEEGLINLALNPEIRWKPSNPYDIITTSIMVEEWNYVIISNWNVGFFAGIFGALFFVIWLVSRREKEW